MNEFIELKADKLKATIHSRFLEENTLYYIIIIDGKEYDGGYTDLQLENVLDDLLDGGFFRRSEEEDDNKFEGIIYGN